MDTSSTVAKRLYSTGRNAVLRGEFDKADKMVKALNRHKAWWHARQLCRFIKRRIDSDAAFLSRFPGGLSA